jgi:hypothetical protein
MARAHITPLCLHFDIQRRPYRRSFVCLTKPRNALSRRSAPGGPRPFGFDRSNVSVKKIDHEYLSSSSYQAVRSSICGQIIPCPLLETRADRSDTGELLIRIIPGSQQFPDPRADLSAIPCRRSPAQFDRSGESSQGHAAINFGPTQSCSGSHLCEPLEPRFLSFEKSISPLCHVHL